ncbi:MAG: tRNA-(ms[2]io[6]A)-hydroxylase [Hahellaceae bacterium]|nr:tRNA-(ms[2]io[6]A)-hydroxylase [Hahellaceae bacterium]
MSDQGILEEINGFLACPTPDAWLDEALRQQEVLLVDHAQCEQKAAATAMRLVYRYPEDTELTLRMSKLAREELRHFEQVVGIMKTRGFAYRKQEASRYAAGLRALVRSGEPKQLIDLLIVGAFIEARSCERFARLAPRLDDELSAFYNGLLASEGRHYRNYLKLARDRSAAPLDERIALFREREGELIVSSDTQFRFHSGCPV